MERYEKIIRKHLGDLLVERGIITAGHLERCLDLQRRDGGMIGEILVQQELATELDIVQAITSQYGFPYLPLATYEVDSDLLDLIPKDLCEEFCVIPIDRIGKNLSIAMSNPLNEKAFEKIESVSGHQVQVFVSTSAHIKALIKKAFSE